MDNNTGNIMTQKIIDDIKTNPNKHQHPSYVELEACCVVNGAVDLKIMQAHEGLFGIGHDVVRGPCSCGAWH